MDKDKHHLDCSFVNPDSFLSLSAEPRTFNEVGLNQDAPSSKNHNVDDVQEDMLQDIYENAIEVCILSFTKLFKPSFIPLASSVGQYLDVAITEENH